MALIILYLSGRLFFYDIDNIVTGQSPKKSSVLKRAFWGLLLIFFCADVTTFFAGILLHTALIAFDSYFRHSTFLSNGLIYGSHLLIAFMTIFLWYNFSGYFQIGENPFAITANGLIRFFNFPEQFQSDATLKKYTVMILGYILTLKEGTIFIRFVLNKISAVPLTNKNHSDKDTAEYERGKLIGILERTFIYFLILFREIGAIAIIIALKSLARFNKLDDKDFAEYFLIGSLLSILVATFPGIIVQIIIHNM